MGAYVVFGEAKLPFAKACHAGFKSAGDVGGRNFDGTKGVWNEIRVYGGRRVVCVSRDVVDDVSPPFDGTKEVVTRSVMRYDFVLYLALL